VVGSVNVLSGAPFGYRYVRKSPLVPAAYQIVEHEAVLVREIFRRYTDEGASIADLTRWLTEQGARTRTGKTRWDRSVIWGMLRNPAYAGQAVFGKTMAINESPGLNRTARRAGRTTPRAVACERLPHATDVAQTMVDTAGTAAIYTSSVLDRLLRDAIRMRQHILAQDRVLELMGGFLLGDQPKLPFV
jgi:hypothetical protein